ncbi:MAG: FAD-dependent oxidoreductase [Phycisphaerae bacterium]
MNANDSEQPISRRDVLRGATLAAPVILAGCSQDRTALAAAAPEAPAAGPATRPAREMHADLVILGGGVGGCAAALAAARHGLRVILTEETDWIGGQLTSQAVPPDENPWIESFGGTRTYREFRTRVRDYYRRNFPLTAEARARWNLDPGNGDVSLLCHEPRVALAVLTEMLAPYVAGGRVVILPQHKAVRADVEKDRVKAVAVRSLCSGSETTLTAPYFADATEMGDVLPLAKVEYVTGAESQKQTGELHAPAEPRPANIQAFTCCFAIDYLDGQDHTIERPAEYDFWRDYVPKMTPPWPGRLLSLTAMHPVTLEPRTHEFDPKDPKGLWVYRRIADRRNYVEGTYPGDISLINWPQNDYWLGNLIDVSEAEAVGNLARAKQLSLSLLYWLQTECPRPDGGTGWKGLRLRPDVVGTEDGLAKYPYIRESRRIRAVFTVLEHHVGTEARMKLTGKTQDEVTAEPFADSVGIGSYRIDLHPSSGGDNYIDVSSLPFQIPLGALIPQRIENLLPACKNLGVTHITNGCYRLHPVEWNIGESVGVLVAYCLARKRIPREVREKQTLLAGLQNTLRSDGVEIAWPRVYPR